MALLAPGRDHADLAGAIARVVDGERPLFEGDADRHRTAALVVALTYRESTLDNSVIGDKGQSYCAGQIHLPGNAKTVEGWTGTELREDASKCITVVVRMLRESIGACRSLPVDERMSVYARGSCTSEQGRRLSRDRFALARRTLAKVQP